MATGFTPSSSPSPSSSAREKTNLIRLSRLLTEIGRRVLQDVFDFIHPPSSLHGVLNTDARVKHQLQGLRTRRTLYEQQWKLLYPTTGIADSKNFDITLLFLLLRNICGLKPPASAVWKNEPLPTDVSEEADLVRIKRCRNELYAHRVEMALTDDEFENNWNDIEAALNRLGRSKYKERIERLKFASVDDENDRCYYAFLQSWGESENAIRKLDESLEKGKVEIIREIQKINEKLDKKTEECKYDETQREIF